MFMQKYKIFDIRGTHGSGKSTIPKTILNEYAHTSVKGLPLTYEGKVGILGYSVPDLELFILGKYETPCGGCDGIKTQDEIKARVEKYSKTSNVLLEGILVAHTFGPWLEFSEGKDWRFLFLDTPLEECIKRVNDRRRAVGKGPLPDAGNVIRDHARIWAMEAKFRASSRSTAWISNVTQFLDYYNDQ